jgi:hypothetical protein
VPRLVVGIVHVERRRSAAAPLVDTENCLSPKNARRRRESSLSAAA